MCNIIVRGVADLQLIGKLEAEPKLKLADKNQKLTTWNGINFSYNHYPSYLLEAI